MNKISSKLLFVFVISSCLLMWQKVYTQPADESTQKKTTIEAKKEPEQRSDKTELPADKKNNDEGQHWWWECKSADLIVKGVIKYDADKYFEIDISRATGQDAFKQYYIIGKIKISKILFINENSRLIDDYKHLKRTLNEEHEIIIPSIRLYFDHMKKDDVTIVPNIPSTYKISGKELIVPLNQIYLYPLHHLVLEDVVPDGKDNIVTEIIAARANH